MVLFVGLSLQLRPAIIANTLAGNCYRDLTDAINDDCNRQYAAHDRALRDRRLTVCNDEDRTNVNGQTKMTLNLAYRVDDGIREDDLLSARVRVERLRLQARFLILSTIRRLDHVGRAHARLTSVLKGLSNLEQDARNNVIRVVDLNDAVLVVTVRVLRQFLRRKSRINDAVIAILLSDVK